MWAIQVLGLYRQEKTEQRLSENSRYSELKTGRNGKKYETKPSKAMELARDSQRGAVRMHDHVHDVFNGQRGCYYADAG